MTSRPGRFLRAVRWAVVGAFVLTCAAAVLSEFRVVHASERYARPWPSQALLERSTLSCWIYTLRPGAVTEVESNSPYADHGFLVTRPPEKTKAGRAWLPQLSIHAFDTAWFVGFRLPLWCPILVLGIPVGAMVWRGPWVRWRRSRRGLCRQCGYDIRGAAVCPECGSSSPTITGGP